MQLYLTHCGAGKNSGVVAPQETYKSSRIQRFVQWCESHSFLGQSYPQNTACSFLMRRSQITTSLETGDSKT